MNKKFKGFFNMNLRHDGGFTLVELIVVIAILAILAGVAIPAYSGYVTKANKTADQTLISDVADALVLYYYSNPDAQTTGGVVVFGVDGKADAKGYGAEAMKAVFGENWDDTLKLKYGQWAGGIKEVLAGYDRDTLDLINNSTYLQESSASSVMTAVNKMTNLAAQVIGASNLSEAQIKQNLLDVLGQNASTEVINALGSDMLTDPTAISNLLVGAMADSLGQNPALQAIVNDYAAAFTYGEKTGDYRVYDKMTANLANVTMDSLTNEGDALEMLYAGFTGQDEYKDGTAYIDGKYTDGTLATDQAALTAMMGAVKEITSNFQDKDSLKNPDLFTSDGMMAQVDGYMSSVKALAGMDDAARELLDGLPEGSVAVLIGEDGSVAVCPGDAWIG